MAAHSLKKLPVPYRSVLCVPKQVNGLNGRRALSYVAPIWNIGTICLMMQEIVSPWLSL